MYAAGAPYLAGLLDSPAALWTRLNGTLKTTLLSLWIQGAYGQRIFHVRQLSLHSIPQLLSPYLFLDTPSIGESLTWFIKSGLNQREEREYGQREHLCCPLGTSGSVP